MAATRYSATYPTGADVRDVAATALANLPSRPDKGPQFDDGPPATVFVVYNTTTLTAQQQTTFQNAVAATAADPNAPWRVADTLTSNVAAALARLRTIQTQATTFQGQAAYGTANLTNLNDLLAKCQTIAGAVHDIAQDLVAVARIMSAQYDGTT